jgi:hypothetical protein
MVELHVPDFAPVRRFYGALGYSVVREEEPSEGRGYLVMRLEGNTLCFWGGSDGIYRHEYFGRFPQTTPPGFGVEIVLQVADLARYYERIKDKVAVSEAPRRRPWGLEDFRLCDPFGFYLRVTEVHDPAETR